MTSESISNLISDSEEIQIEIKGYQEDFKDHATEEEKPDDFNISRELRDIGCEELTKES